MTVALNLDAGLRPDSYDVSIEGSLSRYISAEMRFIDEGKQPYGIKNVNRLLNADGVLNIPYGDFTVFAKGGLTASMLSYNGSGNGYKNTSGFVGANYGIGARYRVYQDWSVQAQVTRSTSPDVGISRPPISCNNVVFPLPLGPIMAVILPRITFKLSASKITLLC